MTRSKLRRCSRPAALAFLGLLVAVTAATRVAAEGLAQVEAIAPAGLTPDRHGGPTVAVLWRESVAAEMAGETERSATLRRAILGLLPRDVHTGWRLARDLMLIGEGLPEADVDGRLPIFEEAREVATRAFELDPSCSECCFYRFAATSRVATTLGAWRSLGLVRQAGEQLATCLAMPLPTWSDADWNHEQANLFYGAAVYYRMIPDSWWAEQIIGFRGDRREATRWARRAVEVSPLRLDYRVELGIALLCVGESEGDEAARREGFDWLAGVDQLPDRMDTDPIDRARAEQVRHEPGSACGNARAVKVE